MRKAQGAFFLLLYALKLISLLENEADRILLPYDHQGIYRRSFQYLLRPTPFHHKNTGRCVKSSVFQGRRDEWHLCSLL